MTDDSQRPKSIYQFFENHLDQCVPTDQRDLYPNLYKTIATPFAPRAFARTLYYYEGDDGQRVYAWVSRVGKRVMIWSVD